MLLLLVLACEGAPEDHHPDEAGWEPLASIATGGVQETGVVALDGKVYVIGGFHETRGIVDDVLVYDPEADAWETAAPLPRPVHHANAAAVGGRIYVVGALVGMGFALIGDVWAYDRDTDAWTERAPLPPGTERGGGAVGVLDGLIYVAGGFRGASVDDFTSYDPARDWHDDALPPLPEARDHLVGAGVGRTFYAIGGRRGGIGAVKDRVDAFRPGEGWSARAPMPTARGGMAGGVVEGRIAVVGGEGNAEADSGVFAAAELYDPEADAWSPLPDMRVPRHGMGAAGIGGALYVPGGAHQEMFGAVATNDRLLIPR